MVFKALHLFLINIFIVVPSFFFAQGDLKFFKLNVDNGLSQNSGTSIIQGSNGFLWFGTMSGLNRFDGYSFKTYYFNPRDTNSLSSSWITTILEDENKSLWIGTRFGGLNLFNPSIGKYVHYVHNPLNPNSLSNNIVNCLLNDGNGNLWVGTE